MQIHLFENGKGIKEGDIFIATLDSVEGHGRVTLTLQPEEYPCLNCETLTNVMCLNKEDLCEDCDGIERDHSMLEEKHD